MPSFPIYSIVRLWLYLITLAWEYSFITFIWNAFVNIFLLCIFSYICIHTHSYAHVIIISLDFVDPCTEYCFHLEQRTLRPMRSESSALSSLLDDEADAATSSLCVLPLLAIFHRDSQTPSMLWVSGLFAMEHEWVDDFLWALSVTASSSSLSPTFHWSLSLRRIQAIQSLPLLKMLARDWVPVWHPYSPSAIALEFSLLGIATVDCHSLNIWDQIWKLWVGYFFAPWGVLGLFLYK